MAAANAATDVADLNRYLEVCGINTAPKRNAFITGQGLSSVRDFASCTTKDATNMIKMHNANAQANHKLGFVIYRNIEALIYYVNDRMR